MHKLTFTNEEMQALAGLINAAVQAVGLRSHEPACRAVIDKLMASEPVEEKEPE